MEDNDPRFKKPSWEITPAKAEPTATREYIPAPRPDTTEPAEMREWFLGELAKMLGVPTATLFRSPAATVADGENER